MDFSENYDNLLKLMSVNFEDKKLIHKISRKSSLLPFKIDNTKPLFEKGFYNILGEFSRILLDKKMKKDFLEKNIINVILNNENVIEIEEGSEKYIAKLLKEYIYNEKNELKLLHPYLYLYIPLSNNKHSGGEKEEALLYLKGLLEEYKSVKEYFRKNNFLTKEYPSTLLNPLLKIVNTLKIEEYFNFKFLLIIFSKSNEYLR